MKLKLTAALAATVLAGTALAEGNPQPTYKLLLTNVNGTESVIASGRSYADCRIEADAYVSERDILVVPLHLGAIRLLPANTRVSCEVDELPAIAPAPLPRPTFGF